jgi:hypothetical protein
MFAQINYNGETQMKIRVIKETISGLQPGVYAAHKFYNNIFAHQSVGVSTLVLNHYIDPDNYEIVPRPASGMGERVMTTTNLLTTASMLYQGFNIRVRDTKTGRFVKWDDIISNANGSLPITTDYINHSYTLRYVLDRERYMRIYHNDGTSNRDILNANGKVTFQETYHETLPRKVMYHRSMDMNGSKYVFEIFA